jgi:hypothetical protein
MKAEDGRGHRRQPERDFKALGGFFSAYLHQDFLDEYGSVAAAAAAFSMDAEPQEVQESLEEWTTWRAGLGDVSPQEAAAAIRKLGGAWQPGTLAELDDLGRALGAGRSGKPSG